MIRRLLLPFLFCAVLVAPVGVVAQEAPEPAIIPQLNTPIPGFEFTKPEGSRNSLLAQYLSAVYRYGVSIAAVAATVMFVYGAFLYLIGSAVTTVANGKQVMQESVLGMVLVLSAVAIVRIVNPELTKLPSLSIDPIESIAFANEDVVDTSVKSQPAASAEPTQTRVGFLGWQSEELARTTYVVATSDAVAQPLTVPEFKQFAGPWANQAYGPEDVAACSGKSDDPYAVAKCCTTFHHAGCGATALAMILAYNQIETDPGKTGAALVKAGARSCNFGTSLSQKVIDRLKGLTGDKTLAFLGRGPTGTRAAIISLRSGQPVVFLCASCTGKTTSNKEKSYKGHYMVLTGVDDTGRIFTVSDVGASTGNGIANISQADLTGHGAGFWALQ